MTTKRTSALRSTFRLGQIFRTIVLALTSTYSILLCPTDATATPSFTFSYSGRLTESNGKPVTGPIALSIAFYRTASGGSPVLTVTDGLSSVALQEGIFQVSLTLSGTDFQTAFPSVTDSVYVEVTDLTHKPGAPYTRQLVAMVPYAAKVPVDGQTLEFNSQGELAMKNSATGGTTAISAINSASTGTISATRLPTLGGDLSGTVASATVSKIQGRSVSTTAPNSGEYLKWNGSSWAPAAGSSSSVAADSITNTEIKSDAAIADTKLATIATAGKVADSALSSNVSLLGPSISLTTEVTGTLPIANGGTGGATQAAAANAILPTQTSNSGKYLTTDGSNVSWSSVSASSSSLSASDGTPAQAVVVDAAGKVGVGSATPTAEMDIRGPNRSDVSGLTNVNIFTTDTEGLDVGGSIGLGGERGGGSAATSFGVIAGRKDSNTAGANSGYLSFATRNGSNVLTERLRLNADGTVGIGTASTGNDRIKFQYSSVVGAVLNLEQTSTISYGNTVYGLYATATGTATHNTAGYFSASGATGNNNALITGSGNVGIGTTTPKAALDVNGAMALAKNGGQPFACAADKDGVIALTSQYTMCVCKGGDANWVQTSNGSSNCSW